MSIFNRHQGQAVLPPSHQPNTLACPAGSSHATAAGLVDSRDSFACSRQAMCTNPVRISLMCSTAENKHVKCHNTLQSYLTWLFSLCHWMVETHICYRCKIENLNNKSYHIHHVNRAPNLGRKCLHHPPQTEFLCRYLIKIFYLIIS